MPEAIVKTDFGVSMTDPATRARLAATVEDIGMAPDGVARAIAFAIGQPADVETGDIAVGPTAQA